MSLSLKAVICTGLSVVCVPKAVLSAQVCQWSMSLRLCYLYRSVSQSVMSSLVQVCQRFVSPRLSILRACQPEVYVTTAVLLVQVCQWFVSLWLCHFYGSVIQRSMSPRLYYLYRSVSGLCHHGCVISTGLSSRGLCHHGCVPVLKRYFVDSYAPQSTPLSFQAVPRAAVGKLW